MKYHVDTHKPRNDRLMKVTGERWVQGGDPTLESAWENSHWPNSHWEECDLQEQWSWKWVPTTVAGLSEARGCRKQRGSFSISVHVRPTLSLMGLCTARDSSKSCSLPAWPTEQFNILVTVQLHSPALWPGCYVFWRDVLDLINLSIGSKPHIL